jgi:GST-like protein
MAAQFIVDGQKGAGSAAVEAAPTLLGLPYVLEESRSAANPMAQVPALILPTGEMMTESAAILIWLAEAYPKAGLAPAPNSGARPAFLRWMAFVSAAIYALYWVRDDPSRVIAGEAAQREVKTRLAERIVHCWSIMEAGLDPSPYLLGDRLSVLDLYVTVVSRWTSRDALHKLVAPRLGEAVRRVEADPRLAALWAERFPLRQG